MDYIEEIRREITYITAYHHEDDDWYFEGQAFLELGRFEEAELKFKELLLSQPEHPDGYQGLAYTYEAQGDFDKAAFFIAEAVRRAASFLEDDALDPEVMDDLLAAQRRMNLKKSRTSESASGTTGHTAGGSVSPARRPRLSAIIDEMELITDFRHVYLNPQTGEMARFGDDELHLAESGGDTVGLADWQAELVEQACKVLVSDDFIPLPTGYEIDEYPMMREFSLSQSDLDKREELLGAIEGRGAFRSFKDAIHRLQITEPWYAFRRRAMRDLAL
jgi:tetratricopeptide (TPR) repeat protein